MFLIAGLVVGGFAWACASFAALKVPTIRQTTSMTTRSSRSLRLPNFVSAVCSQGFCLCVF